MIIRKEVKVWEDIEKYPVNIIYRWASAGKAESAAIKRIANVAKSMKPELKCAVSIKRKNIMKVKEIATENSGVRRRYVE